MKAIKIVKEYMTRSHREDDFREILATIDLCGFKSLKDIYEDTSPTPGYSKYLNIEEWLEIKLKEVYRMGLNKPPCLEILDIGTGAGYFPYICKHFGHNTKAVDLDIVPMYYDVIQFLGIDRVVYEIKAYETMPNFGKKFNLITAFAICFANHRQSGVWKVAEWSFFLKDLANNHLEKIAKYC